MSMKKYLKFAAGFWMSAFLITGSKAKAPTAQAAHAKLTPATVVGPDRQAIPASQS